MENKKLEIDDFVFNLKKSECCQETVSSFMAHKKGRETNHLSEEE